MKKALVVSHGMRGTLDDDYTLYDNGEIVHQYDQNIYPNGMNKTETLRANDLSGKVKKRLINAASEEHKEMVKQLLSS